MKILIALFSLVVSTSYAAPTTFGSKDAKKGGTVTISLSSYPKAVQYYLATDTLSRMITEQVVETLIEQDNVSYETIPRLAESWTISKDKKTFTFKLNKTATFSDGKPVTSKDVKFTWDTIMNPKNNTVPQQSFYADVESCTAVDDHTIEFKTKNVHFQNIEKLGSLFVLPEHFYKDKDFNRTTMTPFIGSGPYKFGEMDPGKKISFERNEKYWGAALKQNQGRYNFDKIVYKIVPDVHVQLEMFKRGDIDFMMVSMAKMWVEELKGESFENNWTHKFRLKTKIPSSMAGLQWNMRKPLFADQKVRMAMSLLMNRAQWIKDLFYNEYIITTGIVSPDSEYHSPKAKAILYNPTQAKKLLAEAGWKEVGSDGVLKKGNDRFEFDLLMVESPLTRALTLYQEDLRKMGVKMNLRAMDWANLLKFSDENNFDSLMVGWTRDVNPSDFAQMWGSAEADMKGSQNKCGYKNPAVDKLVREIDQTFEKKKRVKLVQELDAIIAEAQPMSFLWEANSFRLIHWNRYGQPKEKSPGYSDWHTPLQYWWFDPAKDQALKTAMADKKKL